MKSFIIHYTQSIIVLFYTQLHISGWYCVVKMAQLLGNTTKVSYVLTIAYFNAINAFWPKGPYCPMIIYLRLSTNISWWGARTTSPSIESRMIRLPGAGLRVYLCSIIVVSMCSSSLANASPMQERRPTEKGRKPFCWKTYCPLSSSHLSGLKANGSSQTLSSWWMAQVLFIIMVPFGMS